MGFIDEKIPPVVDQTKRKWVPSPRVDKPEQPRFTPDITQVKTKVVKVGF